MPHAKLLINYRETTISAVGGRTVRLSIRQIRAWVYFGTELMMRQAVVDTGCPICTLPKRVWRELDKLGDIAWVADPPAMGPTHQLTRTTALLGSRYSYRLGRVRVVLADLGDGRLEPRDVFALCTEDPLPAPSQDPLPIVLGLAEVLNGRSLLLQVSESGERWLALLTEP